MADPVKYPYYARWASAVASGEMAIFASVLLGIVAAVALMLVRRLRPDSFSVIRFALVGSLYIGLAAILIWRWAAQ